MLLVRILIFSECRSHQFMVSESLECAGVMSVEGSNIVVVIAIICVVVCSVAVVCIAIDVVSIIIVAIVGVGGGV